MLFAAVVCWAAAAYRVAVSIKGPPRLWRWAFSASLVSLALAATAKASAAGIDRHTGVSNLAILLDHVCAIVGGTSVRIYMVTLRHDQVPRRAVGRELALGGTVILAALVSWLEAPIHAREVPDLAILPPGPALLSFGCVFYLYLALTAAEVSRVSLLQMRPTPREDPTRRLGLGLTAVADALGAAVLLMWTARFAAHATAGLDFPVLATLGAFLVPFSLVGIALGAVMFLIGPVVHDRFRVRRLITELEPLWLRLRQMHPQLALRSSDQRLQDSTVRLERAMIEIQDALGVTRVRMTGRDSYVDVAASILTPATVGPFAADVLPPATSRAEEESSLRRLARCYARAAQSSTTQLSNA